MAVRGFREDGLCSVVGGCHNIPEIPQLENSLRRDPQGILYHRFADHNPFLQNIKGLEHMREKLGRVGKVCTSVDASTYKGGPELAKSEDELVVCL